MIDRLKIDVFETLSTYFPYLLYQHINYPN
jgi:hypothetical protein